MKQTHWVEVRNPRAHDNDLEGINILHNASSGREDLELIMILEGVGEIVGVDRILTVADA